MSLPRKSAAMIAASAALSLAATGCSVANSGADGSGAASGTLRVVLPQEPPTLEPCEASLTATGVVVRSNITEPLLERNPTSGELEPKLATEWTQSTPTLWTFKLRPGVKFSDGSDFTSEDAVAAIERSANNTTLACNVQGYVFGDSGKLTLAAPDATTVTVTTEAPDPLLPLRVSFIEMTQSAISTTTKVREPVGTGPYKIQTWAAGQKLTLATWDGYWGEKPGYATAEYQWREEGTVRAAMVVNGEADVATNLGADDGAGDTAVQYPNNETTALRFTNDQAPLNDIRVRQAIDMLIDRDGIIKSLFGGLGKPASQLIGPGVIGYNEALTPTKYDPAAAKALVDAAKAAGVPVGTQFRIIGRTSQFPKIAESIELMQSAFAQAGLNAKIEMMDTAAQLKYQLRPFVPDAGPIALIVMHGNQAGDAAFTVGQYFATDGAQSTGGSADLDAKIKAAAPLTGAARQQAYADVFQTQTDAVRGFAFLANMEAVLARAKTVDYTPDAATGDEMRLTDMKPKA
ncbi:ABC transporter substrate-binding protein [Actinoplanes derwentensis]|uniref:Peptide/nickel transport system substrate-binding protein n=1 Tax=Actinoplanes derwentensis TaxID=113562 RepID=A0A1H1TJ00_9ACTN|nr:ABC transporter substrate-binding protein [Actinoplanes derwentensis]GID85042.1 peptide ABC transporter substrate-binding protein [Actinoplanes derwentensis]SDS60051.1 peptide/nickel transport system substrate-binding protein [Actinoplanes derwentensis]